MTVFVDLVNCLLRGVKNLEAHFIMRGDENPHLRKCVEFPMHYNSKLKMGWTKLKNMGSSRKPTGYVGLAQLWQKKADNTVRIC